MSERRRSLKRSLERQFSSADLGQCSGADGGADGRQELVGAAAALDKATALAILSAAAERATEAREAGRVTLGPAAALASPRCLSEE